MTIRRSLCVWLLAAGCVGMPAVPETSFESGCARGEEVRLPRPSLAEASATITGCAARERMWSDGRSTTVLRFEVRRPDGLPAAGVRLRLDVKEPEIGDVAASEVITDSDGTAVVEYRVGTRPGSNVVAASTAEGLVATIVLHHGGLEMTVRTVRLKMDKAGMPPMAVAVRLVDPDGRPIRKAAIGAEVDEREVSGRGRLVRAPKLDDASAGWRAWNYTLPPIDLREGWKDGRIELRFFTEAPGHGVPMELVLAFTLHGRTALLPPAGGVVSPPAQALAAVRTEPMR